MIGFSFARELFCTNLSKDNRRFMSKQIESGPSSFRGFSS